MWLALDIGNSAVKGGLFDGEALRESFRLALAHRDAREGWEAALDEALAGQPVERAGIASVVPAATAVVAPLLARRYGVQAQVIRHTMRLPFRHTYQTPETLGTDRLAAAAAAWTQYGSPGVPVIALDAGTALTYEVIDAEGVYRGGVIAAGPALLRDALAHGTAQLPAVPLEAPPSPLGRSTREALQAGIVWGFVDGVHGMLARLSGLLGAAPLVVATGGWAGFLHEHLDEIDHVEPHLVLHGIRVLMALNEGDNAPDNIR